ncbi:MAG: hypothetical protein M1305_01365, partial [Candidatus Marsarchaeota archaeon]|nr:hypothetical protein [Candidatus Marsarchaeota archaeon]
GQDREDKALVSTLTGVDQLDPFQLRALPSRSTAMQKLEVGQEIDSIGWAPSMLVGLDQLDPFQLMALPYQSTAMQKLELVQDMELMVDFVSIVVGVDHACPSIGVALT